jgi:hypothetical protein
MIDIEGRNVGRSQNSTSLSCGKIEKNLPMSKSFMFGSPVEKAVGTAAPNQVWMD